MEDVKEGLALLIQNAIEKVASQKGVILPEGFAVLLERPKREGQGDFATNAAMQLCKVFKTPPAALAAEFIANIKNGGIIKSLEVAGPGFLNITLSDTWVSDVIRSVLSADGDYGRNNMGEGKKVQVEFVSANPTGPIHLGHGRGAAVGDIMSSILAFSGWVVEREYYINDAGLQMENLGKSTQSHYFELLNKGELAPFPVDGYPGDYIIDIAKSVMARYGDTLAEQPLEDTQPYFRDETASKVLEMIRKDLSDFGVEFDVWFSEKSLYDDDLVDRTIALLKKADYAYDLDGAVWFRSTAFGDDKDRVMIRANGMPTYFTSDIAYLQNKYERGFDFLIYVWGADHHGYIPRIRSVNKALGADDDKLDILLIQFVSLLRNGVPVAMSKRAGSFVTLREVLDEVGKDATRFFFVSRKCDSHLDFDLEIAKQSSADNPVFYVQYAHARICSILREAASRGFAMPEPSELDSGAISEPTETQLVKVISRFPEEVAKAASGHEPHRIAFYATDLAEAFHAFYNAQRVLGAEDNIMRSRLLLTEATRITLKNCLGLLGITAPESM